MEIDAILCNHAEAADNKLYLSGGGIDMAIVQPNPPHIVNVGIGVVVHIPYSKTNEQHRLLITLVDEDGGLVQPFVPEGQPEPPPLRIEFPFNVGRPPLIRVGDEQTLSIAANFVGLPLVRLGLYVFIIEVNGTEMRRLSLRVMTQPQPNMPTLSGNPIT